MARRRLAIVVVVVVVIVVVVVRVVVVVVALALVVDVRFDLGTCRSQAVKSPNRSQIGANVDSCAQNTSDMLPTSLPGIPRPTLACSLQSGPGRCAVQAACKQT